MTKEILRPAAYYFPTTVLLVDDDKEYLESVENILDRDAAIYKSFNNPNKVYEYVKTNFKPQQLTQLCIEKRADATHHTNEVYVNINPIAQEVFNSKRFEHISAIVADHDMPEMKGIDLLKKLKDVPIRKILLTGKATLQETLDAYNDGGIDQYISKDQNDFQNCLRETITKQCQEHFKVDTRRIFELRVYNNKKISRNLFCLNSYEFMELLDNIVKEHNLSEYYLIDDNGSYIFYDIDANPSWLIVKDQDTLNDDIALAEKNAASLSPEVMQKLKEHTLILTFISEENKNVPAKDWIEKGILQPAKKFTVNDQYFSYAYINNDTASNVIDKSKIISFCQYQEQLPD